jgi:hypothetical protein
LGQQGLCKLHHAQHVKARREILREECHLLSSGSCGGTCDRRRKEKNKKRFENNHKHEIEIGKKYRVKMTAMGEGKGSEGKGREGESTGD